MPVAFDTLGPMTEIAGGAAGTVYRLHSFRLPGQPGALAFKDIHPDGRLTDAQRQQALRSMETTVALRDGMSPAERAALDPYATWPLVTVERDGATVGIVMPLLEDDFFLTATPPGGPSTRKVFSYSYLSPPDDRMRNLGIDRTPMNDPLVRLSLNAQLAFVIALLHKHDIVYGDLSLKNIAVAANPPRLRLLDCDAAAPLNDLHRSQMHTLNFKPPEIVAQSQKLQDRETDTYKLGLCVLRSMVTGRGVTQLADPQELARHNALDPVGVDLITRALSPVRADRPTAKEICLYLERTVRARTSPPDVTAVALNRAALRRGGDVVVTWTVDAAVSMRLYGPNGLVVDIDKPYGYPTGYTITPAASGEIVVEATNRYGSTQATAGYVELYDLPAVTPPPLPIPQIPAVPPVQLPATMTAVPPRPLVTTAAHPVPRLDAPSMAGLLGEIGPVLPGDMFLAPGRRAAGNLRDAQREVSDEIAGLITETMAAATAVVRGAATTGRREGRP